MEAKNVSIKDVRFVVSVMIIGAILIAFICTNPIADIVTALK